MESQYVFARETFSQVIDDITPLLKEHWEELALNRDTVPLDPDLRAYDLMENANVLRVFTARVQETRELVGYAIYFVRGHHHYKSTKWAMSDIVLIRQGHRNYGVGSGLLAFAELALRQDGVGVMTTMAKLAHPKLSQLLELLGHERVEVIHSKRLAPWA